MNKVKVGEIYARAGISHHYSWRHIIIVDVDITEEHVTVLRCDGQIKCIYYHQIDEFFVKL